MKWIWPRTQLKFTDILRHPFGSKTPNGNPFQKTGGGMYGNFPFESNVNIYTRAKDLLSSKPCKTLFIKHTIDLENVLRY